MLCNPWWHWWAWGIQAEQWRVQGAMKNALPRLWAPQLSSDSFLLLFTKVKMESGAYKPLLSCMASECWVSRLGFILKQFKCLRGFFYVLLFVRNIDVLWWVMKEDVLPPYPSTFWNFPQNKISSFLTTLNLDLWRHRPNIELQPLWQERISRFIKKIWPPS